MDCVHVEQGLLQLIKTMKGLRTISLPRYFLTHDITEALGIHPSIETILHSIDWPGDPDYQPAGTRVRFQEGWFLNLGRISIDVSPGHLITLLQNPYRPPQLYSIKLTTLRERVDIDEIRELFVTIPQAYPNLTRLLLDMFYPPEDTDGMTGDGVKAAKNRISFDIIRPLLKCSRMQTFRIWHNNPLEVSESDTLELAKSWPRLVHLDFGEDPHIRPDMPQGLPMIVLTHFAIHCRRLQTLYLYVDTSTGTSFDNVVPRPIPKFNTTLEWLSFGTSPVADVYQTARILSQMCDHDPVTIGYGAGPCHIGAQEEGDYGSRNDEWAEVSKLFKSLYRYRKTLETRHPDSYGKL
ncbi:hypothetical protein FRC03_005936 [Tulasnella sp. 419]|nr:hypothetical protein FRC02_010850 [Tulasnella sp. 418]KAG8960953.1 hypothetical protein FRC03_005936 [Tulasnella sp. 419]